MADSATCLDSRCTNCGSAKTLKVGREASLFEHPGIVENVVAYLGLYDMLNLGSCSKYLNGVSESNCTWKLLYKRRWDPHAAAESPEDAQTPPDNKKRWKAAYIARQKELFAKISKVLSEVQKQIQNDCLSSPAFQTGIVQLKALGITYDDIYSLFFSKKLNVIFVMLGLYYAFFVLRVSKEDLKRAMTQRGVIDKMVCARWTLERSWQYGFYMPEENHMRSYSLGEVVEKEMSLLFLMRQANILQRRDEIARLSFSYKIPEPSKAEPENKASKKTS